MNYLAEIVSAQKRGEARGIAAICSAHSAVLEAILTHGKNTGAPILIEATCNQVNQFGGYTGMQPKDFVHFVGELAERLGFSRPNLIFGGDHLGPTPWQAEPAAVALQKSKLLVREYVQAGFSKIHLDASMKLGDDPPGPLPVEVAAERTAELALIAEEAFRPGGTAQAPCYVIGTEVPLAGGLQGEKEKPEVTTVSNLMETLESSRAAFLCRGLEAAWERVIAVVVQPGVEYGNDFIWDYDHAAAAALARFSEGQSQWIYEAHSTDYQTRPALQNMVKDHFAVLKVGPALTFAVREAIFALALIEMELFPAGQHSDLLAVVDRAMLDNPLYWQKYYHGDDVTQRVARKYSFSDRLRYYWPSTEVKGAVKHLMVNLADKPLPLSLVSQYLPVQYERIRTRSLNNSAQAVITDKILDVFKDYQFAVAQENRDSVRSYAMNENSEV